MTAKKHHDYEDPPVVEVVCGVLFKPNPKLTVAHVGRLWEALGDGFDQVQEVPPLVSFIERFDGQLEGKTVNDGLATLVMPRVWFVSGKGDHLVQFQRDRFLCNWRKLAPEHKYPDYDWVIGEFYKQLTQFEEFYRRELGSPPSYIQYELTYINHILAGAGWSDLGDLGAVLPDCAWRKQDGRFLPAPQGLDWRLTFDLPEQQGRLHVHAANGERERDNQKLLLLDLTARGFGDDLHKWFDLAREWIVRGFTDLTGSSIQKSVWRRKL